MALDSWGKRLETIIKKRAGIDEALLSRVLRKKAHLSIDKLEAALAPLGYRVALVRSPARPSRSQAPSIAG